MNEAARKPLPADRQDMLGKARQGAHRVLRECLGLESGDVLALFYDETTDECAFLLIQAAALAGITVIQRLVTTEEQIYLSQMPVLPHKDTEILTRSRANLLCLGSHWQATPYRKRLVKAGVGGGPLGTMPGATLEVLAQAVNIDYTEASRRCGDLALAMLNGQHAVVTTWQLDAAGRPVGDGRKLEMKLGAFARSPITSPGIIPDGTWGNLPGGETFIAPLEGSGQGTFVLNGAFTGHVLQRSNPILLSFEQGSLAGIDGTGPEADALRQLCSKGTPVGHKLGLAELGIGVNPGVGELRGNALFDEKKEGTVHIAVGDNAEFGGRLSASIHEDFVTCSPSLTIDGKPVLTAGEWRLRDTDWREDIAQAIEMGRSLPSLFLVQARFVDTRIDAAGRLEVRRDVGAKRACIYTVGADDLSRDLARLHDKIPDGLIRFDLLLPECQRQPGLGNEDYIRGLLGVLVKHQLAEIRTDDEWD